MKDKEGDPLRSVAAPNGVREAAINAAIGLSAEEAAASFSRSLVGTRARMRPDRWRQQRKSA